MYKKENRHGRIVCRGNFKGCEHFCVRGCWGIKIWNRFWLRKEMRGSDSELFFKFPWGDSKTVSKQDEVFDFASNCPLDDGCETTLENCSPIFCMVSTKKAIWFFRVATSVFNAAFSDCVSDLNATISVCLSDLIVAKWALRLAFSTCKSEITSPNSQLEILKLSIPRTNLLTLSVKHPYSSSSFEEQSEKELE